MWFYFWLFFYFSSRTKKSKKSSYIATTNNIPTTNSPTTTNNSPTTTKNIQQQVAQQQNKKQLNVPVNLNFFTELLIFYLSVKIRRNNKYVEKTLKIDNENYIIKLKPLIINYNFLASGKFSYIR